MAGVFAELKRRNVFRVGIAYVIVAWLLIQVTDSIVPMLALPDWVGKFIFVVLLIGFPLALFFAWAFELTPEGLKREKEIDRSESVTAQTGHKLDRVIIGVLVVAVGFLLIEKFVLQSDEGTPGEQATGTLDLASVAKSIAVLPFVSLSESKQDEYFADGLAEELLNSLTQYPDLRVAGRTSSFSFKGKDQDLRTIGETLNVAYILEGSVRRSADRLRVTAQLIQADSGFHLWSDTFDRTVADVFAIQDEIVRKITQALRIQLAIDEDTAEQTQLEDWTAYNHYLKGRYLWAERHEPDNRRAAIQTLELATQTDPDFAPAWAAYGRALALSSGAVTAMSSREHIEHTRQVLKRALELDPESSEAHAAYGALLWTSDLEWARAKEHLDKALTISPNSAAAHYAMSTYAHNIGDDTGALSSMRRAMTLDPLNFTIKRVAARNLAAAGQVSSAQREIDACKQLTGCETQALRALEFEVAASMNDVEAAERIMQEIEKNERTTLNFFPLAISVRVLALQGERSAVYEKIAELEAEIKDSQVGYPVIQIALSLYALGDYEGAVAWMKQAYDWRELAFAAFLWGLSERWEYNEEFRRHPDYIALWELPGLKELAELRVANGQTAGLPLQPASAGK